MFLLNTKMKKKQKQNFNLLIQKKIIQLIEFPVP